MGYLEGRSNRQEIKDVINEKEYPYLSYYLWRDWMKLDKGPLIVLGHNWELFDPGLPKKPTDTLELSVPSKLNTLAGLVCLKLGLHDKLIFSGGATAKARLSKIDHKDAAKTEALAMKEYADKVMSTSNDNILLEEDSRDTFTNAEYSWGMLDTTKELSGISLSSISFHINQRAHGIFKDSYPGDENLILGSLPSEVFLKEIMTLAGSNIKFAELIGFDLKTEIAHNLAKLDFKRTNSPLHHGWPYHLAAKIIADMPKKLFGKNSSGESLLKLITQNIREG